MPRDLDLQKHTINLRAGDMDYLASLAHPQGYYASDVVRKLVSNFVDDQRKKEQDLGQPAGGPLTDNDLRSVGLD